MIVALSAAVLPACSVVEDVSGPSASTQPVQEQPAIEVPADRVVLVREVQSMLTDKGYDPGPADGMPGSKTTAALNEYQRASGYTVTDGVTAEAYRQLASDHGGSVATGARSASRGSSSEGSTETYTRADESEAESGIYGNPPASSPFSKVKVGMSLKQVTDLVGEPTDQRGYVTGKAWIPFYYGKDRTRVEYRYKSQGVVTFVGSGGFSSAHTVYRVIYNPEETGYNR